MLKRIMFVAAVASVLTAMPAAAQECGGESAMVCGRVWNDVDNDGIQDRGEKGIVGKMVTLSGGSSTLGAYTDGSGFFIFEDVPIGSYTLSVSTSLIGSTAQASPTNTTDDSVDSDGTSDGATSSVTLAVTTTFQKQDFDFGFYTR